MLVSADIGGPYLPLYLWPGVASTPGRVSQALSFSGAWPASAFSPTSVVDTTKSFTISVVASADATRDCLYQSFVSQDGVMVSGFSVGIDAACAPGNPSLRFMMQASDSDTATQYVAKGTTRVQPGRWYHVVAVRDTGASQMRLYVDGVLEAVANNPDSWAATGMFAVGRARSGGVERDQFLGKIDDVAVFDRALTPAEVAALG